MCHIIFQSTNFHAWTIEIACLELRSAAKQKFKKSIRPLSPPLSVQQPFPFRRVGGWSEKVHKAKPSLWEYQGRNSFYGIPVPKRMVLHWLHLSLPIFAFHRFSHAFVSPSICSAGFGDTWHFCYPIFWEKHTGKSMNTVPFMWKNCMQFPTT